MLRFRNDLASFVALSVLFAAGPARAQPTPDARHFMPPVNENDRAPTPADYEPAPLPGAPEPLKDAEPPPPPLPPEPPYARFGTKGQFVLTDGASLGFINTWFDSSQATHLSVTVSPALHYFVVDNVSLGLALGVTYTDDKGYASDGTLVENKGTTVSVAPELGVNIPFGDAVSWWLRGAVGFESNRYTTSIAAPSPTGTSSFAAPLPLSQDGAWFSLYFPLLLHPAPNFFFGAGPNVFHDFAGYQGAGASDQRTAFGVGTVIGGTWGATPNAEVKNDAASPPAGDVPARARRFGEHGEILLTNEISAGMHSTAYQGTPSSAFSGSANIAADVFATDQVSVGVGLGGGGSNHSNVDANGNGDDQRHQLHFLLPRGRGGAPLGDRLLLSARVDRRRPRRRGRAHRAERRLVHLCGAVRRSFGAPDGARRSTLRRRARPLDLA
jgi:hypothetical protein